MAIVVSNSGARVTSLDGRIVVVGPVVIEEALPGEIQGDRSVARKVGVLVLPDWQKALFTRIKYNRWTPHYGRTKGIKRWSRVFKALSGFWTPYDRRD